MSAAMSVAVPRSSVRWRIFAIVFVLVVINLVDRTALSVAMPTISKEFALTPTMQGVILSAFFWSYAVLQVPGGWLIDRFGPRLLISVSTMLWALFQGLAAAATGGVSLLLTRVGLGAAFGGVIISSLILGFDSWRLAFLAAAVGTLVMGFVAWRYLRDNPALHPGVNPAELAHIRGHGAVERDAADAAKRIEPRSLAGILIGRMGWAMMNFGLLTWGPSYLAQARGLDLKQMGGATFVIFLSGMFGSLCGGFLADALLKRGFSRALVYKGLLGFSGLATMASFILLPEVADPVWAVAVLSSTLFFLYWGSLYWSFPAVLAPRSKVGVVGGLMNFAGSASGIAVPIITGVILQVTGAYLEVLYFFAACAALYVLATMFVKFPREAPAP